MNTKNNKVKSKKVKTTQKKKVSKNNKISKKKKNKRKIRYGRVLLYIILPIILIIFVLSCIHFPIKNIYINGNVNMTDQEIIELAGISNYPSIFEYSSNEIEKKLEKNKYIISAKVYKRKLKEIYIEITENIPILYNAYSKETIFSDGKSYSGNDATCMLVNYTPSTHLKSLSSGLINLDSNVRKRISEIQYVPNDVDEERFLLTMNDENYVYITLGKINILNNYIDIIKNFDTKKGILYLDSGEYFEIKQ